MKQGLFWTMLGLALGATVAWATLGPPQSIRQTRAASDMAADNSSGQVSPQGL